MQQFTLYPIETVTNIHKQSAKSVSFKLS